MPACTLAINIAVFCSGNGSNFQALVDNVNNGNIDAKIALMVCDRPNAYALQRAKQTGIKNLLLERENFKSRDEHETVIIQHLAKENIGLICLAGYMRLLSPKLVQHYKNKILNIHPSLLPSFKGLHAIKQALDQKAKITGVTVHFVDEETDHGTIVLQESVEIYDNDTEQSLVQRIHTIEHQLYPQAVKLFVEDKLTLEGRKVKIKSDH